MVARALLEEFAMAAVPITWGAVWALLAPGAIGMCASGAIAALATAATSAFSAAADADAAAASTAATAVGAGGRTIRVAASGDIGLASLIRFIRLDFSENLDDAFAGGGQIASGFHDAYLVVQVRGNERT